MTNARVRVRWNRRTSGRGAMAAILLLSLIAAAPARAQGGAPSDDAPWVRHTIDSRSRGADGVRLGDANGDGLTDLVTGWEEGGLVRVYLHPGPERARQPWPAVTVGAVGSPEDAVFADLDGDGALDVVSACEGTTKTVYVHWAPTDTEAYADSAAWTTQPIPVTQGAQRWMYVLPMQIDGQNGIDLLVGSKDEGAAVGWLQAPEDPRRLEAWTYHGLYEAGWIMSLEPADLDGDGDGDVVVSDRREEGRGVLWLENPGPEAAAAGRPWRVHRIGGTGQEVMFLDVADVNGDGRPDVTAAVKLAHVLVLQHPGDPTGAWPSYAIKPDTARVGRAKAVRVTDVDGDGRPDVLFSGESAFAPRSGVVWLPLRKGATDVRNVSGAEGVKFDLMQLLDVDADGDLDVITCEEVDNLGVVWYENPAGE